MADHKFYEVEDRKNEREVTVVNVTSLVSKPPTKEKRIRLKVRMLLSGKSNAGAPEWLDAAMAYVMKWHEKVVPKIEFRGYEIHISADNLFGKKGVKAPRCMLRSFEITEFGDAETPDVVANFTLYIPFSRSMWNWLGQYVGDDVWCSLTPGVDGGPTDSEDDDEDGDEESGDGEEEEAPSKPAKSGPKQLAAFHQQEVEKDKKGKKKSK